MASLNTVIVGVETTFDTVRNSTRKVRNKKRKKANPHVLMRFCGLGDMQSARPDAF